MRTYHYDHIVPFQDTDMAGVAHYISILGYVELAEHAFLKELGISPISEKGGFPKVHVDCDYSRPLRFGDVIRVSLTLSEYSSRTLHWEFDIAEYDEASGNIVASGKLVTTFVDSQGKSIEMPKDWQGLLGE